MEMLAEMPESRKRRLVDQPENYELRTGNEICRQPRPEARTLPGQFNKMYVGGDYDNRENLRKIANLRLQIANLLGHKTYADHIISAGWPNTDNVYELLNKLLDAYKPTAERICRCAGL